MIPIQDTMSMPDQDALLYIYQNIQARLNSVRNGQLDYSAFSLALEDINTLKADIKSCTERFNNFYTKQLEDQGYTYTPEVVELYDEVDDEPAELSLHYLVVGIKAINIVRNSVAVPAVYNVPLSTLDLLVSKLDTTLAKAVESYEDASDPRERVPVTLVMTDSVVKTTLNKTVYVRSLFRSATNKYGESVDVTVAIPTDCKLPTDKIGSFEYPVTYTDGTLNGKPNTATAVVKFEVTESSAEGE